MNKKVLAFMFIAFLLLSGCGTKTITDETTEYDLPIIEQINEEYIIHMVRNDGMHRSVHYPVKSQLVIDPKFYDTKEISRGDVVYYKTTFTEEEFNVARVVSLPGETVVVKNGQVYINDLKLETFYGKEYHISGYVDGTDKALSKEEIKIPENHYFLAGDVWWRSFIFEPLSKDKIRGKVVGRIR